MGRPPNRLLTPQKVPADEVGGGEIVMARNRYQWASEIVCHRFDETCLSATGRALEHQRQPLAKSRFEYDLFVSHSSVVRP
jgi:hypothetical protein